MWSALLVACAFRAPAEPPPLASARAAVATVPVPGDQIVATVRAGSAYDPSGREGLAMITAFAVATKVQAWLIFGPDTVTFAVPAESGAALAMALTTPVTAEEFRVGREAVEVGRQRASCPEIAEAAWDTWVYAGHPYGHPETGRISVLPTLTEIEARGLQAQRYVRGASLVGLPATVAPIPAFDALAIALSRPATPATMPSYPGRRVLVVEAPVGASCVVAGHPAPLPVSDAARAAHVLFRFAYTEGRPDPVRREARLLTRRDLSDGPDPFVAHQVLAELGQLDSAGLSVALFDQARTRALASLDTVHEVDELTSRLLLGFPPAPPLRAVLDAAVQADVNQALVDALDPAQLRVVIVTADASPFRTESGAGSDVQAIVTAEELFR